MKIGITGGAGFIGGHVVDVALSRGHEVVVFDRQGRTETLIDDMTTPALRVSRFLGDVRDHVAMGELAAHVDGIIHLAACLGTQETISNPRPAVETNIGGGIHFLESCVRYDIPGVYIGVGNHWMANPYSITKSSVERFATMYNRDRGGKINVVRLVNAYGPRQSVAPPYGPAKVRKIMPSFICRALTGAPIEIYGDGEQISDMVHVHDGALALVKALEFAARGDVFDEPVEVGPTWSRTVNEVAELVIAEVAQLKIAPESPDAYTVKHLPMRPGEVPGAIVSADTGTMSYVDMDPGYLIQLGDGIRQTVAWYAKHWLPTYLQIKQRDPHGLLRAAGLS